MLPVLACPLRRARAAAAFAAFTAFTALAALATALPAHASGPGATAALALSADGSEVHDLRARLAWPRCLHGMQWRGQRCEGQPQRLTYGQAQKLAQSRHSDDALRWRLPRAKELQRLRQSAAAPGQATLLPAVPGDWHWTGTAAVNASAVNQYTYDQTGPGRNRLAAQQAWAVDWATGQASGEMGRGQALLVRLVRPLATP